LKIVLDTSVLIAAFYKPLAGPSFSREVYDYVVQHEEGIVSLFILKEFREKCVKKLKFSIEKTLTYETLIRKKLVVQQVDDKKSLPADVRLRDPDDRPILQLALAIRASILLTWDKDLLVLKSVAHCAIRTPREFWDALS